MTENLIEKITIVIVAYNSNELLIKCLNSIKEFNTIIVDNGKNEKIISQIDTSKTNIKLISKNENIGFSKGVNFASEFVRTDYFLILNADTFITINSIQELYNSCENNIDCGAAAPIIDINKDGYDLFPENGKSIKRNEQQSQISKILHNQKPEGEVCVEVSKLGLLINKKNFFKIGKFDEKFFMFWEEVDLCKRFRINKFSVIINPKATIVHDVRKSSNNDLKTFLIKTFHLELSPLYYFKIKKNYEFLYFRIFKYFFRGCTYILIFNFKKSVKNFVKAFAILFYLFS